MTRLQRNFIAGVVLLGWGISLGLHTRVTAAPTTSPSARHAARLKYHPPAGWIRHYLGDDRYRIDGGIWRVVSTQMDIYYHRPSCPNMMRQSRDIVIGFPNAENAVEGGYRPDPMCRPEVPFVEYAGGSGDAGMDGGLSGGPDGAGGGGAVSNRPRRITLADGVSTTILPPNWRSLRPVTSSFAGRGGGNITMQLNQLVAPGRNPSAVVFGFMTLPGNLNAEAMLQPDTFRSWVNYATAAKQTGQLDSATASRVSQLSKVGPGKLGGINGVAVNVPRGPGVPIGQRVTAVGRGNKIYYMVNVGNAPGMRTAINAFQPR